MVDNCWFEVDYGQDIVTDKHMLQDIDGGFKETGFVSGYDMCSYLNQCMIIPVSLQHQKHDIFESEEVVCICSNIPVEQAYDSHNSKWAILKYHRDHDSPYFTIQYNPDVV
jgi:hypothetical protein